MISRATMSTRRDDFYFRSRRQDRRLIQFHSGIQAGMKKQCDRLTTFKRESKEYILNTIQYFASTDSIIILFFVFIFYNGVFFLLRILYFGIAEEAE